MGYSISQLTGKPVKDFKFTRLPLVNSLPYYQGHIWNNTNMSKILKKYPCKYCGKECESALSRSQHVYHQHAGENGEKATEMCPNCHKFKPKTNFKVKVFIFILANIKLFFKDQFIFLPPLAWIISFKFHIHLNLKEACQELHSTLVDGQYNCYVTIITRMYRALGTFSTIVRPL